MGAYNGEIFVSIPQLTNESDWLVWRLQVQHALKASGQWEFVTGDVNQEAEGYKGKKQKALYSIQCVGQRFMPMLMDFRPQMTCGICSVSILRERQLVTRFYTNAVAWVTHEEGYMGPGASASSGRVV